MKMKNILILYTTLALAFTLTACGSPPTAKPTIPAPTVSSENTNTDISYHFVTNRLFVPTTQADAKTWALNLDNDPQQSLDNLFGNMLAMLTSVSPGLELQSTLDEMINSGQVVMLQALKTDNLENDPNAEWTLYRGVETESTPRFDGSDAFTVDASSSGNSAINGSITNGHFSGGPASTRVQMAFMGIPLEMELIGVHIEADITANGCTNGKLGGGLTEEKFHSVFLPAFVNGLNKTLAANTGSTFAQALLIAFDADQNGSITQVELENNVLFKAATSPDLDLLDASSQFNPGQDGVKDSLSMGLGFTCLPASFVIPGN